MKLFTVVALGAGLLGCSVIIDTSPYVGEGSDAGPTDADLDGASDGGEDPDGPSAPVVAITPEAPRTLDDLALVITTESVDPLDAGPVRYEIRWLRDGEATSLDAERVPASETAKGQTFRVEVRGISDDGRRGAVGAAEVQIQNTPPRLTWVAMNGYRPIVGEPLRVIIGPVLDDDGDPTNVDVEWRVDGDVVAVTGPMLPTGELAPGATLTARVVARDVDASGAPRDVGPAIVLSDEVRWRELLPTANLTTVVDPGNDRVLLFDRQSPELGLWEMQLPMGRLVKLRPQGPTPETLWPVPFERGEALIFPEQARTPNPRFWRLHVGVRGAERWELITPSGSAPSPAEIPRAYVYDPVEDRVLTLLPDGDEVALWACDFSTEGFENWAPVADVTRADLPSVDRFAAAVYYDAPRRRALYFGGFRLEVGLPPVTEVLALDLDAPEEGFTVAGDIESLTGFFTNPVPHPDGDSFLLVSALDDRVFRVDPATLTTTVVAEAPGGDAPRGPAFSALSSDQRSLFFAYLVATTERPRVARLDLAAGTLSEVVSAERFGPGSSASPIVASTGTGAMRLYDRTTDEVWELGGGLEWRRVETLPDGPSGLRPTAVPPQQGESNSPWRDLRVVDGEGVAWVLGDDARPRWVRHSLGGDSGPAPAMRAGMATSFPACGQLVLNTFGGQELGGAYSNELLSLECRSEFVRDCVWGLGPSPQPDARAYSSFVRVAGDETVLFGGRAGSAVYRDVRMFASCSGGPWVAGMVDGSSPPSRWGHSASLTAEAVSAGDVATVLIVGGSGGIAMPTYFNDVWQLDRVERGRYRWSEIDVAADDEVLVPRHRHVSWYDRARSRLLVFGGSGEGSELGDLWELRLPAD